MKVKIIIYILIIFLIFNITNQTYAGTPAVWGTLEPGDYGIGFKTIETYDYTRVYRSKTDYFGNKIEGERSRPIQIQIWYPAITENDDFNMVYGEYAFPYPENNDFIQRTIGFQNRENNRILARYSFNSGFLSVYMNINFASTRDAKTVEGNFPLILYISPLNSSFSDNAILCEYLASHGFIVVSTQSAGLYQIQSSLNSRDIETQIRDIAFTLAQAKDLPNVDRNRIGVIGFHTGAIKALLLSMRNTDIDAVVSLGNALVEKDYLDFLRNDNFYDVNQITIPLLNISYSDSTSQDYTTLLLDSLIYSQRYSYLMKNITLNDLSIENSINSLIMNNDQESNIYGNPVHEKICQTIGYFLKSYLNNDEQSKNMLNKNSSDQLFGELIADLSISEGAENPPSQSELEQMLFGTQIDTGIELYYKFTASNPTLYHLNEALINNLGYTLLQRGMFAQSREVMKINTLQYPESPNSWDSYADALLANGDSANAAVCYKTILELLPKTNNISESIRVTIQNNAETFLSTYKK